MDTADNNNISANECHKSRELSNKFSFSITNILSDNFGKPTTTISKTLFYKTGRKEKIFRPFDDNETKSNSSSNTRQQQQSLNDSIIFYNSLHENESSNNSIQEVIDENHHASAIFFKNFQLAELLHLTSKRIDEENSKSDIKTNFATNYQQYKLNQEILNYNKLKNTIDVTPSTSVSSIPPLGSLSKAVSQIGQDSTSSSLLSPPFSSYRNLSTSPRFESDASSYRAETETVYSSNSTNPAEGIDSDDCKSEASSSKDDNQKMWPAWIYCTRYSDRPSSGRR